MTAYLENGFSPINQAWPFTCLRVMNERAPDASQGRLKVCLSVSISTQSASVTASPGAVTSAADCGWQRDGGAAACVTTAATTRRAATVRTAGRASTETPAFRKPPLTPANVRPSNPSVSRRVKSVCSPNN